MKLLRNFIVIIIVFVCGIGVGYVLFHSQTTVNDSEGIDTFFNNNTNANIADIISELNEKGIDIDISDAQKLYSKSDIINEAYQDIQNGLSENEFINKYKDDVKDIINEEELEKIYETIKAKLAN